jgi:hypothetical protein
MSARIAFRRARPRADEAATGIFSSAPYGRTTMPTASLTDA